MVTFKIQCGFWPKWDGEGDPTGPVFWEDEDEGGGYATAEEARAGIDSLAEVCGYDARRFRVQAVMS